MTHSEDFDNSDIFSATPAESAPVYPVKKEHVAAFQELITKHLHLLYKLSHALHEGVAGYMLTNEVLPVHGQDLSKQHMVSIKDQLVSDVNFLDNCESLLSSSRMPSDESIHELSLALVSIKHVLLEEAEDIFNAAAQHPGFARKHSEIQQGLHLISYLKPLLTQLPDTRPELEPSISDYFLTNQAAQFHKQRKILHDVSRLRPYCHRLSRANSMMLEDINAETLPSCAEADIDAWRNRIGEVQSVLDLVGPALAKIAHRQSLIDLEEKEPLHDSKGKESPKLANARSQIVALQRLPETFESYLLMLDTMLAVLPDITEEQQRLRHDACKTREMLVEHVQPLLANRHSTRLALQEYFYKDMNHDPASAHTINLRAM